MRVFTINVRSKIKCRCSVNFSFQLKVSTVIFSERLHHDIGKIVLVLVKKLFLLNIFGRKLFVKIPVFGFGTLSFDTCEEFKYKILYSVFVKTKTKNKTALIQIQ